MSSIDNRVVQMQFNNREFEQGVSDTLKSLEVLENYLKNLGNGDYGDNLTSALSGVGDSVSDVSKNFNAFEEVAIGALRRIGEKAIELGLDIGKSLSTDQLIEGWNKYENQVTATAGIYNIAKYYGKTYEDVLGYIQQLQWYADATSFSMDAMLSAYLSAINAGTDMDDASEVIMGLGNAFMYAGATATEMDGAFAMFSKVMSDEANLGQAVYRSLEQVYKIITPELKNRFIETALAMGKISDAEAEIIEKDFKGSLADKWLTGDIVKEVMSGQYGGYANEVYKFANAWTAGNIKITDSTKKLADEMGVQEGSILTTSQAMELYDMEMQSTGQDIDEFGKATFQSAMEAKKFSEVVDAIADQLSTQWTRIFTAIFGDYQKAKDLFTSLGDYLAGVFVTPMAGVADMVEEWAKKGGRDNLLQIFRNIASTFENLLGPINKAFKEVFPPLTTERLLEFTEKIKALTESIIPSEQAMENIKNIAGIVLRGFKLVVSVIGAALSIFTNFWEITKPVRDIFIETLSIIAKGINKIYDFVMSIGVLENMSKQVTYTWSKLKNKLNDFWQGFSDGKVIIKMIRDVYSEMLTFTIDMESLSGTWENVKTWVIDLFNTISGKLIPVWGDLKTKAVDTLSKIVNWFNIVIQKTKDFAKDLKTNLIDPVYNAFMNIENYIKKIIGGLAGFIGQLFTALKDVLVGSETAFEKARERMGQGTNLISGIKTIANVIFGIVAKIDILKILDALKEGANRIKEIPKTIQSLQVPFNELGNTLKKFQKQVKAKTLKEIALSMIALAAAMYIVSKIDTDKLISSFAIIGTLLAEMAGVLGLMSKMSTSSIKISKKGLSSSGGLLTFASALVTFGMAIMLIAAAVKTISGIGDGDVELMWNSVIAVGALMGALIIFISVAGLFAKIVSTESLKAMNSLGVMTLKFASGILILAQAMKLIGSLDEEQFVRGLVGLGAILVAIGVMYLAVMAIITKSKIGPARMDAFGKSLLMLAASIMLISAAVSVLSMVNPGRVAVAAFALAGIIAAFALASKWAESSNNILKFAGALAIMGVALGMLAVGLFVLGMIPLKQLGQGLVILVGLLASLAIVSELIGTGNSATGLITMSAAMLILGPACVGLAVGLTALGMIPWAPLLKGLFAFVSIIGIMAIAGAILTQFSGGLISLGLSAIGLGFGIMLAAVGLTLLIGLLETIRALSDSGALEHAFYDIGAAAAAIFFGFIETLIEHLPTLVVDCLAAIDVIIIAIFDFIESEGGQKLFSIIGNLIGLLPDLISKIIEILIKLIGNLFVEITLAIISGITGMTEEEVEAARQSAHEFINGFAKGITEWINKGLKAVLDFGKQMLSGLKEVLGIHSPSTETKDVAGNVVQGFVNGIKDKTKGAVDSMKELGSSSLEGLKEGILGGLSTSSLLDTVGLDDTFSITPVLDLSQIQAGTGDLQNMLNDVSSQAIGTGFSDPYNYDIDSLSQLSELNSGLSNLNSSGISSDGMAASIKDALNGVGVYADGKKIGKLVTIYQANVSRAGGY